MPFNSEIIELKTITTPELKALTTVLIKKGIITKQELLDEL